MPPKLISDDGSNVVIRPMAYVEERDLIAYADERRYPVVRCSCPTCGLPDQQRQVVKRMLSSLEAEHKGLKTQMLAAMKNVKAAHLLDRELSGQARMKFVCDKCNTRYSIADERVHGRVLKIRCKACNNVITVREEHAPAPAAPAAASSLEDALSNFQQRDDEQTRVSSMPPIDRAAAASTTGTSRSTAIRRGRCRLRARSIACAPSGRAAKSATAGAPASSSGCRSRRCRSSRRRCSSCRRRFRRCARVRRTGQQPARALTDGQAGRGALADGHRSRR